METSGRAALSHCEGLAREYLSRRLIQLMLFKLQWKVNLYSSIWQGCVRGQHGRGQGQGSSRPRPEVFEAKATKFCPRGVLDVEASPWGPPSLGFFLPRELHRERLCQVVCLSITLKFNALLPRSCACVWTMKYCIYGIESFTYHTKKFNVLRPDLEAKVKAAHRRGQGQGQGSSRPRPQNFVLELSSRSRPVLEDPIPGIWPSSVGFHMRKNIQGPNYKNILR